ncbi:MAG TPA: phosphatase PAP2 family protein [Verrucomicrobiae bacterium]|nr:phosphatase PAP2 family protein [Verrucomicrobiae bacterium]
MLVSAWFAFVFVGANWATAQRVTRVRVHFDAELQIPLIPSFTLIYMSIYGLFLVAPFVLRTRREITSLAIAQAITILVAGICFLLIPARLAFAPAADSQLGIWRGMFRYADRLNLDYNLVPSLHVALSIVCIELFASHANFAGKTLLRAWGVLIAAATVLTHQHHLVDALTGFLLALAVVKFVRRSQH